MKDLTPFTAYVNEIKSSPHPLGGEWGNWSLPDIASWIRGGEGSNILTGKDCDAYRQGRFENKEGVTQDQKNRPNQTDFIASEIQAKDLKDINALCTSNNTYESLRHWEFNKDSKGIRDVYRWGKLHVRLMKSGSIMYHYESINPTIRPIIHGIVDYGGYLLGRYIFGTIDNTDTWERAQ